MLAEKFESDSAGSQNSAEVVKPYASKFPTKEHHFYSDPSATLANLDTEIAGQVDQFDREAIAEVFISLLGYYLSQVTCALLSGAFMTLCKLGPPKHAACPKPPYISDLLLAKMGGLDGSGSTCSAQRSPLRKSCGLKSSHYAVR
jgi:hypothetical protein